jgi:hypothetical protein
VFNGPESLIDLLAVMLPNRRSFVLIENEYAIQDLVPLRQLLKFSPNGFVAVQLQNH